MSLLDWAYALENGNPLKYSLLSQKLIKSKNFTLRNFATQNRPFGLSLSSPLRKRITSVNLCLTLKNLILIINVFLDTFARRSENVTSFKRFENLSLSSKGRPPQIFSSRFNSSSSSLRLTEPRGQN